MPRTVKAISLACVVVVMNACGEYECLFALAASLFVAYVFLIRGTVVVADFLICVAVRAFNIVAQYLLPVTFSRTSLALFIDGAA